MKALNLVGVLFIALSGFNVVSVGQWFRQFLDVRLICKKKNQSVQFKYE